MMNGKVGVYSGIALLVLVGGALFPLLSFYFKLPSEGQIKPGSSLSSLFVDFKKEFTSSIATEAVPEVMECLSCLPNSRAPNDCNPLMASFVAKSLAEASNGMASWHLSNLYLMKALAMKYDSKTLSSIYFAMLANIFRENDVNSVCQRSFGKSCAQLQASELRSLQRSFLSGKIPPPEAPSDDVFSACFSK